MMTHSGETDVASGLDAADRALWNSGALGRVTVPARLTVAAGRACGTAGGVGLTLVAMRKKRRRGARTAGNRRACYEN